MRFSSLIFHYSIFISVATSLFITFCTLYKTTERFRCWSFLWSFEQEFKVKLLTQWSFWYSKVKLSLPLCRKAELHLHSKLHYKRWLHLPVRANLVDFIFNEIIIAQKSVIYNKKIKNSCIIGKIIV